MTSGRLNQVTWMQAARMAWFAILFLQAAVFLIGMSVWFPALHQVCNDTVLACQQRLQLSPVQVDNMTTIGWSLDGYALYNLVTRLTQKVLGVGIGILIFWRKPNDRMAWVTSVFLLVGLETSVSDVLANALPLWWFPTRILALIGSATFALFVYLFPSGAFVPRWTRWLALIWTLAFVGVSLFPHTVLDINQSVGTAAIFITVFSLTIILAQVYRYRRVSNATERLQTKWVFAAIALSLAGIIVGLALVVGIGGTDNRPTPMSPLYLMADLAFSASAYLLPVSIGIAVLRYHLWDIDVIIRKTLVYSVLTGLLALIYFGGVVLVQQLTRSITASSDLAIAVSTLIIAALFFPLRRRVQNAIDRRFYRRKYDAAKTLAAFSATVRDEVELEKLTAELINMVNETMQPASVSLWLRPTHNNANQD
jgi:hypothetical protein